MKLLELAKSWCATSYCINIYTESFEIRIDMIFKLAFIKRSFRLYLHCVKINVMLLMNFGYGC